MRGEGRAAGGDGRRVVRRAGAAGDPEEVRRVGARVRARAGDPGDRERAGRGEARGRRDDQRAAGEVLAGAVDRRRGRAGCDGLDRDGVRRRA